MIAARTIDLAIDCLAPILSWLIGFAIGATLLYAIGSWLGWGSLAWLCVGLVIGSCGDAAMLVVTQWGGRR